MTLTRLVTVALLSALPLASMAETLKLAVTTSFDNSGLADVLLPEIKADTGIEVHLIVVGTGQALRLGRAGDVDAILVHARAAEEQFVEDGYGVERVEIMYNDFVVIGPADDPADLGGATDAISALRAIRQARAPFVSRGDDSGTHKKEQALWEAAGHDAESLDPEWYRAAGAGMGATLNTASAMGAYVLSDRASWLTFGNKGDLTILFEGDPDLFNQYAYLAVNPARHDHVQAIAASLLQTWLTSPRAQELINGYTLNDQTLFTFNATR